jgi:hypothetical protein
VLQHRGFDLRQAGATERKAPGSAPRSVRCARPKSINEEVEQEFEALVHVSAHYFPSYSNQVGKPLRGKGSKVVAYHAQDFLRWRDAAAGGLQVDGFLHGEAVHDHWKQLGVAGFTVASVLCGMAPNPGFLIAARVAQGVCAAVLVPQVLSMINVSFPPHERPKAYSIYGAFVGLATVSGPLIGALLVEADLLGLDWRPIFLINLPIGLAILIAAVSSYPNHARYIRRNSIWPV